MNNWLTNGADEGFGLENIPFGIVSRKGDKGRVCTRIGAWVIDLHQLALCGYLDSGLSHVLESSRLNDLMALGRPRTSDLRKRLQELFSPGNRTLQEDAAARERAIFPLAEGTCLLPVEVGDYTDFYSSREHATNVGVMFRDPANALLPNWLHLPVGYHGRASSIVVSGTPVIRPHGQILPNDAQAPVFGASKQLDFELEVGCVIGQENPLGRPVPIGETDDFVFGLVLFNDWSARDIQKWEYVPLGPFLGKNFASSISPWVVTYEALQPFRCEGPEQETPVLPYLRQPGPGSYDIRLEVKLITAGGESAVISRTNFNHLYWTLNQQLAHHTINGCNLRIGDVCASGTISGPTPDSYGSMLELAWKGTKPVPVGNQTRTFLQDGDTLVISGYAEKDGLKVSLGEVSGTVLPAIDL